LEYRVQFLILYLRNGNEGSNNNSKEVKEDEKDSVNRT
jgi:hypothetical protein